MIIHAHDLGYLMVIPFTLELSPHQTPRPSGCRGLRTSFLQ